MSTPKMQSVTVEEQFSKRVWSILKGTTSQISTGGFLELDSPPTISLKTNGKSFTIEPARKQYNDGYGDEAKAKLVERQVKNLKGLLDEMPKAAFGHGQETVYDKSIRDALQLKASDFDLGVISDRHLNRILAKVKKDLNIQTDIVAELYSLNAYQKGGKFVKHKDTPRGDDMLGTLVVCLPSLFQGGEFSLSMGNLNPKYFKASHYEYESDGGWYAWWKEPYGSKPKTLLPWCAFYADVDHEIGEVTAGLRMTAAYLIRRKEASTPAPLPRAIDGGEQAVILQKEMGDALRNEAFLEDGGKIGSPCVHMYTNQEIFPGKKDSSEALTTKQINKLKGRDLMLASVAASFGLKVFLVPYLSHDCQGDMSDLRLGKFPKKKKCPRYMDENDVESFFEGDLPKETDECFGDPPSKDADVWILQYGDTEQAETSVGSTDNYNAEGYYGNEASSTTFYVKSALFLQVPAHSESRGQEKEEAKPAAKRAKASA